MNWEKLKQFNCNPPDYVLPRTKEVEAKYKIHSDWIKSKGLTISEYIKSTVFNDNVNYLKHRVSLNTFPYNLEKGIKHYLIWFNPKFTNNDENFNSPEYSKFIEDYIIKSAYPEGKYPDLEFIYFENLPDNRSVNGVRHIHVFVKCNK